MNGGFWKSWSFGFNCTITAYLLKRGTTWNHLKLPENRWNHPETTWNQPCCSISLLFLISYSQVEFVLILHSRVFFGQIWSQKLKFFELTKIWYWGSLLYPHFEFNGFFPQFFWLTFFWANLIPEYEVLQINWNLIQGYIATCLLRL